MQLIFLIYCFPGIWYKRFFFHVFLTRLSVKFDSVAFYSLWLPARIWITHNSFVNVGLLVAQHNGICTVLLFANMESNGQNTFSLCLQQLTPIESDNVTVDNQSSIKQQRDPSATFIQNQVLNSFSSCCLVQYHNIWGALQLQLKRGAAIQLQEKPVKPLLNSKHFT